MGLINKPFPDFVPLTAAESAKVNADFNLLYTTINGNLNDDNIATLANIQQSKILSLPADLALIRATRVNEVQIQLFTITVGTLTYNKPSDLLFADIIAIGGGGGGGSPNFAATGLRAGGGGGGGGMGRSLLFATAIGATEVVTVGGAGGGGTFGTSGNTGGASSFGALVGANGGAGGAAGVDNSVTQGGIGGSGNAGQILVGGSDAGFGLAEGPGAWCGGHGGASPMGGGGFGAFAGVSASLGRSFGGGGGGGLAEISTNSLGAVGGNGIVIVIEFKS